MWRRAAVKLQSDTSFEAQQLNMQISEKNDDVSERLKNINGHFSYNLYENVCRSLFEKDKLLFSALLSMRILSSQCLLSDDSVSFLLTGGVGIAEANVEPPENRCDCSIGVQIIFSGPCDGYRNMPKHRATTIQHSGIRIGHAKLRVVQHKISSVQRMDFSKDVGRGLPSCDDEFHLPEPSIGDPKRHNIVAAAL